MRGRTLASAAAFVLHAGAATIAAKALTPNLREADRCREGTTIPDSNRTEDTPCSGVEGDECFFKCRENFIKVGRHVCQSYETQGTVVLFKTFYGGRCERTCETVFHAQHKGEWCPHDTVPARWKSQDSQGECLATSCWEPRDVLKALALGNYEVWSMARNPATGIYIGRVNLQRTRLEQNWGYAHLGVTGLGLMLECAAHALGWISIAKAQYKVLQTLVSLAGGTPGFQLDRNSHGWMPTHFDSNNGTKVRPDANYTAYDSGLNIAGVLFAATYFQKNAPHARETERIIRLASKLYGMVDFAHLLCNREHVLDESGTGIGASFGFLDECASQVPLSTDGLYNFSEIAYTAWLAYKQGCHASKKYGDCPNSGLQRMWTAFQGRRFAVHNTFEGRPLLSTFPSYVVQLPFYTVYPVISDPHWRELVDSYRLVDMAYYHGPAFYAGDMGRYGLAAGYTDRKCSKSGLSYEVPQFAAYPSPGCRIYSPSAVAGYAAVAPHTVETDLLSLLEKGDGVWKLQDSDSFVLLRQSALEPDWHPEVDVTMIDFASEMLGLLSLVLGSDFFADNTDHDFDTFLQGGGYSAIQRQAVP